MPKDTPRYFPILLFAIWVLAWGAAYRHLRHPGLGPSYSDFQIAVWGGLGFLVGHYAFRKDKSELLDPHAPPQPVLDPQGYWRIRLDGLHDLCFATEPEKEFVPKGSKARGIDRLHSLVADTSELSVDDERRVWVWLEWLVVGTPAERYTTDLG